MPPLRCVPSKAVVRAVRRGKLTVRKEYLMGLMAMRVKAVLVLWLLCLSAPCSGQVKVPDTPAGQKFAAWLEVFNRGDREAYKAFVEQNYPSEAKHPNQAMPFRERRAAFASRKRDQSRPHRRSHCSREGT